MRNYWYVSLTNEYPRTIDDCSVRVVRSVQIKKKYPMQWDMYSNVLYGALKYYDLPDLIRL